LSKDDREKVTSVTKWTRLTDWHQQGLENPSLGNDKDTVDWNSGENSGIVRSNTES
jgi:hypothetical protein